MIQLISDIPNGYEILRLRSKLKYLRHLRQCGVAIADLRQSGWGRFLDATIGFSLP